MHVTTVSVMCIIVVMKYRTFCENLLHISWPRQITMLRNTFLKKHLRYY